MVGYQGIYQLHMTESSGPFIMAQNDSACRRIVLLRALASIASMILLAVPPILCAHLQPDIATNFPMLTAPEEASTLWVSRAVLPPGTYGFFVVAVAASAMTTLDTGLNRNAGFFTINLYKHRLRPSASETELLLTSKIATALFAAVVIVIALLFHSQRSENLFEQILRLNGVLVTPFSIPLGLGILITNTPKWSGWTTAAISFVTVLLADTVVDYEWLSKLLNGETGNVELLAASMNILITVLVGTSWYLSTSLWYRESNSSQEFQTAIDTPIEASHTDETKSQRLLFGSTIALFSILLFLASLCAKSSTAWFSLVFCACPSALLGSLLLLSSTKLRRKRKHDRSTIRHQ